MTGLAGAAASTARELGALKSSVVSCGALFLLVGCCDNTGEQVTTHAIAIPIIRNLVLFIGSRLINS